MSIVANINPDLLLWAREEQGYDLPFVINKLKLKNLPLWEKGKEKPTFPQMLKLAHFYKRPSAVFYLQKPSESTKKKRVDFRTQAQKYDITPETRTEIRLCESRRDYALELCEILIMKNRFNLPDISLNSDIEKMVIKIREHLNINQSEIFSLKDDKEALEYWITKLEENNILVFHSITLNGWNSSYKDIRGTSSYYPEFPWILINSQEHPRGQLFTLGHELAHLLLHGSSICTLEEENPVKDLAGIEIFCNQFSASLQIPLDIFNAFRKEQNLNFNNQEQLDRSIDKMKKYFHVSPEAAARRLYTLDFANKDYYINVREKQIRDLDSSRKKSRGGDGTKYYKRVLKWNGTKYTNLIFNAFHENKISYAEVARALRTDIKHLDSIERELYR